MKQTLVMLTLALWALGQTGCGACNKLFGLDRRCDTATEGHVAPIECLNDFVQDIDVTPVELEMESQPAAGCLMQVIEHRQ